MIKEPIIDIKNITFEYEGLYNEVWSIEHGIRSICVMYDEHSNDKRSHDNIYTLKDNITYRLFALIHQFQLFVREKCFVQDHLQAMNKKDPKYLKSFYGGNPHFEQAEQQLSSIFDSLIFHVSSVFDYFGHLTSYICQTKKDKSYYWTQIVKAARGTGNEFSLLEISKIIDEADRLFVGRLYDYRARLLHNKRDKHHFVPIRGEAFEFMVVASDTAMKEFKAIREYQTIGKIALPYLSSWLIRQTFFYLEKLLFGLRIEILRDSHFHKNIQQPKNDIGFVFVFADPITNEAKPVSDKLWTDFVNRKKVHPLPRTVN